MISRDDLPETPEWRCDPRPCVLDKPAPPVVPLNVVLGSE